MIPYGPWRPDAAAINTPVCREAVNVLPAVTGFKPLQSLAPSSNALPGAGSCLGAAVVFRSDGSVHSFAGTPSKLCKLDTSLTWQDVSRTVGGPYATGSGERWRFAVYGDIVIAATISAPLQKFTLGVSSNFTPLGGSPPQARYIDVVRDFVLIGGLFGAENRVQWSAINNAEGWTPGLNSSDYQDFPSGGPVRGVIGGEVGYVFQANKVTRMTFAPGSAEIFQFDEVEGGRGVAAPHSLVKIGNDAFYMANDGFYKFSLGSGSSTPLGVGKWANWFQEDLRQSTEQLVLGGVDPSRRVIMWAYVPRSSTGTNPTRVIIYDWALDEATIADIAVDAMSQWLTQGLTLDTINSFGTLDTLPFSLDSPVWRGGVGLLGIFGTDRKLGYLQGPTLPATLVTADGQQALRAFVKGTRPAIDTQAITVEIAGRERDADVVTFNGPESMEDTGICPAHASGNIMRARVRIAAGATWTLAKGLDVDVKRIGKR